MPLEKYVIYSFELEYCVCPGDLKNTSFKKIPTKPRHRGQ